MDLGEIVAIAAILLIIGGAVAYIIKAKKSGKKCIGCPDSGSCHAKGGCNSDSCGNCSGCGGCGNSDGNSSGCGCDGAHAKEHSDSEGK